MQKQRGAEYAAFGHTGKGMDIVEAEGQDGAAGKIHEDESGGKGKSHGKSPWLRMRRFLTKRRNRAAECRRSGREGESGRRGASLCRKAKEHGAKVSGKAAEEAPPAQEEDAERTRQGMRTKTPRT